MRRFLILCLCVLGQFATISIPIGVTVALTSCANSPTSYKTLATTQAATTAILNAFGEARAKGQVSDDDYRKVDAAYQKYQAAFAAAVSVARLNLDAATPTEVSELASALASAVSLATGGAK